MNRIAREGSLCKLYINGEVKEWCLREDWSDEIREKWEHMIETAGTEEERSAQVSATASKITAKLPDEVLEIGPDWWGCHEVDSGGVKTDTQPKQPKKKEQSREGMAREAKDGAWEASRENGSQMPLPLPFWTVWDLMQYCSTCDHDQCSPDGDCELVKATMVHGEPWKWDLESRLLSHQDLQICIAMGANCVTVNDMEKGVVTLWANEPRNEWGVYAGQIDETGKREAPLAVMPTDIHFQAFRHAGVIQGAMLVRVPKRRFNEWNKRQEEDF